MLKLLTAALEKLRGALGWHSAANHELLCL